VAYREWKKLWNIRLRRSVLAWATEDITNALLQKCSFGWETGLLARERKLLQ
jgi:hypothetical protein